MLTNKAQKAKSSHCNTCNGSIKIQHKSHFKLETQPYKVEAAGATTLANFLAWGWVKGFFKNECFKESFVLK
jgi:hypothetical protein